MEVLIVSATAFEIQPTLQHLKEKYIEHRPYHFQQGSLGVQVLITGVGQAMTAYALGKVLNAERYQLAINAGIAGSFRRDWPLGKVVQITEDQFADLGVEEADGSFTSIFELDLMEKDVPPFKSGKLKNERAGQFGFLDPARGITVNRVHGFPEHIAQIQEKFPEAEIETMEGAAFFLSCLSENLPFLAIRSLSNYVEKRQREKWDIPVAITNLNEVLLAMLQTLANDN